MKRPSKWVLIGLLVILICIVGVVLYVTKRAPSVSSGDNEESSVQTISSTADFNRALVDISKFMSIYDDTSYIDAKTSMNYSGEVGNKYFSSNSTFISYSGQTNVEIHKIGLDKSDLSSKIRKYSARVLLMGYDYSGNVCTEVYMVKIAYDNSLITKIEKIKMN